jgi:23S rRNA (uridine2552-2'-O)-methyltransferase
MGTNARWQDHYTRRAKKEGFPARSVFKLSELQESYRFLKPGQRILDLGASPGSWLKYAGGIAGPSGDAAGVDIKALEIPLVPPMRFVQADVFQLTEEDVARIGEGFDVVLSDMAPNTSGIRGVDALRSAALSEQALHLAGRFLREGGVFVCKIFQGDGFDQFVAAVKRDYAKHKIIKPRTTRKQSKEIYILGFNKTGGVHVRT